MAHLAENCLVPEARGRSNFQDYHSTYRIASDCELELSLGKSSARSDASLYVP